jgi:hypothetical protein
MTFSSSIKATTRMGPEHSGQSSGSTSQVFFTSRAQAQGATQALGVSSSIGGLLDIIQGHLSSEAYCR